jgi:AcrR family transcriptional regulator
MLNVQNIFSTTTENPHWRNPRLAPRKELQEKRREQLTVAAMRIIVSKGYDHVTIEDVCGEILMSRGIANYYFKNKEELLISVLERMVRRSTGSIRAFFDLKEDPSDDEALYRAIKATIRRRDPEDLLRTGIEALVHYLRENRDTALVYLEFLSQANRNPSIGVLINYVNQRSCEITEMIIREGVRVGAFQVSDPRTSAEILVSSGIGIFVGHAVGEGFFNIEDKTGEMFDFAMAYLKGPGAGNRAHDNRSGVSNA